MHQDQKSFTLIETEAQLNAFAESNKNIDWLCFDTEFIGERRYVTLLCLIQVTTPNGSYFIDPIKLKRLDPFLKMLENPAILKVTHAGDNDYRLLFANYGIVPSNTFDTQVAAAFIGYKYPVSFRKLVETELNIFLNKGYAVTDWDQRPINAKQLKYAMNDVLPLYDLWKSLEDKLRTAGRLHWAQEEFARMESAAFYDKDPIEDILAGNIMASLSPKEQVFLIRLSLWRRAQAKEKNYSQEMILPGKLISAIVKTIHSGKDALLNNRRIPEKIADRYGDLFYDFYNQKITPEERAWLNQIPQENTDTNKEDLVTEMVSLVIRHKCQEAGVAHNLVVSKNTIKKIGANGFEEGDHPLESGWRREFLGDQIVQWMEDRDQLEIAIEGSTIRLQPRTEALQANSPN